MFSDQLFIPEPSKDKWLYPVQSVQSTLSTVYHYHSSGQSSF